MPLTIIIKYCATIIKEKYTCKCEVHTRHIETHFRSNSGTIESMVVSWNRSTAFLIITTNTVLWVRCNYDRDILTPVSGKSSLTCNVSAVIVPKLVAFKLFAATVFEMRDVVVTETLRAMECDSRTCTCAGSLYFHIWQ